MKETLWKWVLLSCFFFITKQGNSQKLQGIVKDSIGVDVPYAGVNLLSQELIVAYTVCNEKGLYSISIPQGFDKDKLWLEANSIGYKSKRIKVNSSNNIHNFSLLPDILILKSVVIKAQRPIVTRRNDTLDYKVSDFSSLQDRVIGDVLKKMPGINIDESGKISYNGKAISKFYIGGDDLLDDKYNIATNSIPLGVVDKVQVMQNHQPVKLLQGKVVSDDVALNVTIKKDATLKLIGRSTLGAGFPKKYDGEVNAMSFKDKYKAIEYIKANNTGTDLANDLKSQNLSNHIRTTDNLQPDNLLSTGGNGSPDLPSSHYLFNQSGLVTLNNLLHIKDIQVKANISYLSDVQKQYHNGSTKIQLPNSKISYTEIQQNRWRPNLLNIQLSLNLNTPKDFINGIFRSSINKYFTYSTMLSNASSINQSFNVKTYDFSNELSYLKKSNSGQIFEFYNYISYFSKPEILTVDQISSDNNEQIPYQNLIQKADIPTWSTKNYFSFKLPVGRITQQYKIGFNLQSQQLQSTFNTTEFSQSIKFAIDSSVNNLRWERKKIFAEGGLDIPGKKLRLSLRLPLFFQQTKYSENTYNLERYLNQIYINPEVLFKYKVGHENDISFNYNILHDVGEIEDVYRGFIFTSYRSLNSNYMDFNRRRMYTIGVTFNYNKSLNLFFFSINTSYNNIKENNITSNSTTPNFQQSMVLPFPNTRGNWRITTSISKYAFALHTTFNSEASYNVNLTNYVQNNVFLPYSTQSFNLSVGAETKLNSAVELNYKVSYMKTTSSSSVALGSTFVQFHQKAFINYSPFRNLSFVLSAKSYLIKQTNMNDLNYIFSDFSVRHKLVKRKLEIELNALNLLNLRTYTKSYLLANTFISSEYRLPGRMIIGKISFNF